MQDDQTMKPPSAAGVGKTDQAPPRYLDAQPRRQPLGRLRTDDEARLAAEIEKLRNG